MMRKLIHWLSKLVGKRSKVASWRDELAAEFHVRSLEERLVFHAAPLMQMGSPTAGGDAPSASASTLQVSLNEAGRLRIEDVSGRAVDDSIQIRLDAEHRRIEVRSGAASTGGGATEQTDANTLVFDANLVSSIEIITAAGNDSVILDLDDRWNGSITIDTGSGSDHVQLTGSAQASIAYQSGNDSTGHIAVDSRSASLQIEWRGLEHISDSLSAQVRSFEFDTTNSNIVILDDAGRPNGNSLRLQSAGTLIVFTPPAEQLRVKVSSDAGTTGRLEINGEIHLRGADLSASSANLAVNGSIITAGAQIELLAQERLDVAAQGRLASASGRILLDAGEHGTIQVAGVIDVSNQDAYGVAGEVRVTGREVQVVGNAVIDASGTSGGGRVFIGGGYQGQNAAIRNAANTYFAEGASVRANALEIGKGGTVIIWADENAIVAGSGNLSARGGRLSGDGGLIETSGKNWLYVNAAPDARAPHGRSGMWLLDPRNVTVVNGGTAVLAGGVLTPIANNTTIDAATIEAALEAGTSVTINTGTTGTQDGDITVSESILVNAGATDVTLTLDAADDIVINSSIISTSPKLNVVLQAGAGNVNVNAVVTTKGGNFSSTGRVFENAAAITTNGGNVSIVHTADVRIAADINAGSAGTATVTSSTQDILFLGNSTLTVGAATLSAASIVSGAGTVDIDTSGTNGNVSLSVSTGGIGQLGNRFSVFTGNGHVTISTSATKDTFLTSPAAIKFGNVSTRDLNALAGGGMTQTAGTTLTAAGIATFSASAAGITLTEANSFSALTFSSTGNVSISETGAMSITGTNTAAALVLTATGALSNVATASLITTGNSRFVGSSIDIGRQLGDTFQAASLTFNSTGTVQINENDSTTLSGSSTSGNLTLQSGGAIAGGAAAVDISAGGTVALTAAGALGTSANHLVVSATGVVTLTAAGATGHIYLDSPASLTLGTITTAVGTAQTVSFSTTAGAITVDDVASNDSWLLSAAGALTFSGASFTAAGLNATSGGAMTQAAASALSVATAEFTNTGTGTILLDQNNQFTGLTFNSLNAVSIRESGGMNVAGTNTAGTLTLTATAALTTSATVGVVVTGATTLNGTSIDFASGVGDNFSSGSLSFNSIGTVVIVESNAMQLLGANTAATLTLTAGGDLTQSGGSLTVTGNGYFTTTSGGITLNQDVQLGTLRFSSAGAVTVVEGDATTLFGASNADSLSLTSSGAITQPSGNITITNNAFFADSAGAGISVNKANTFGSLSFTSTGFVEIHENNPTALSGVNTAGSLDIHSGGAITQSAGSLTVTGNALFTNAAFAITVDQLNQFGSLSFISGGAVTFREVNDTQLLGANTSNSLSLTSGGDISQAGGSLTATNLAFFQSTAGNITLDQAVSLGALQFNATGMVNVQETGATDLAGTSAANALVLTSTGAITQSSGGITVDTNARFTDGGGAGISVDKSNAFGSVSFNSTGAVAIVESNAMQLSGANTAATLTLNAGGALTQSGGSLTVTGAGFFSTTAAGVTLDQGVRLGSLRFNSAGLVTIVEADATDLAGASNADSFFLTSGGAISQSSSGLTITNNARFADTAGAGITLDKVNAFGSLSFNSTGAVALVESNAMQLSGANTAATLTLTAGGAMTQVGGSLTVTGAGFFSTTAAGVTLDQAVRLGSLRFNSAGLVTIVEADATDLAGASVADGLFLTSGGAITQASNGLTIANNARFADTAGAGITLDKVNAFGSVSFNSTGSVAIIETNALQLSGVNTAGTLSLTAGGAMTQNGGSLSVTGNALFTNGAFAITVDQTNQFGSLSFNSGGAVTIRETDATQLQGINAANGLTLTSGGNVTQSALGSLMVTAAAVVQSTAGNVTLDQLVSLGSLQFNATGAVLVLETGSTDLAGASSAASAQITSTGSITQSSGSLTIVGNAKFADGLGAGISVIQANSFGSVSFNSTAAVSLSEANAMQLDGANAAGTLNLAAGGAMTQNGGSLTVSGNAFFSTTAGGITLDQALSLGSLRFNSPGFVTISETGATSLFGVSNAGSLLLTSTAAITQPSGNITVTNNARFVDGGGLGISVDKANSFGTLSFNSAGLVSIYETNAMTLAGANSAGTLALSSGGALNQSGGSLAVISEGFFTSVGGGITLDQAVSLGSLRFNSTGAVTVFETDATDLSGVSNSDSLSLTSAGAITQSVGTLTITNNARFADGGGAGISLDKVNSFGSLGFNSTGAVAIRETGNMDLSGVNSAGTLNLLATGAIAQANGSSLTVPGSVTVAGTAITLDQINQFGTINFNSAGAVTIAEIDVLNVDGINTAGSLILNSTGLVTNNNNSSVVVIGITRLSGASVSFGTQAGDTFRTGSLRFNSVGAVTIVEDDATTLEGSGTSGALLLVSGGPITSGAALVDFTSTGNVQLFAAGAIGSALNPLALTSTAGTVSATTQGVAGDVFLTGVGGFAVGTIATDPATPQTVSIATTGGPLVFTAAVVSNDNWLLNVAGSLTLETLSTLSLAATAAGSIAQSAGSTLTTVGGATFTSTGGGTITLDRPNQFGTINFNTGGGVTLVESDATEIVGVNTAGSLSVTSGAVIHEGPAASMTVTGNARFADGAGAGVALDGVNRFGTLTFNSTGNVGITEADGTTFAGASSAAALMINSAGAVSQAMGASLAITSHATFIAGNAGITLDQVNVFGSVGFTTTGGAVIREADATLFNGASTAASLSVVSAASIDQTLMSSLTINGAANFADGGGAGIRLLQANRFGNLTVNSTGVVSISEADGTQLAGANSAAALNLQSAGAITEAGGMTLNVSGDASFIASAGGAITFDQTNRFGRVSFGTLGNVTLHEADDTRLVGSNSAAGLTLNSAGALTEEVGVDLTVNGLATFTAGAGGMLLDQNNRFGALTFNSPGTVTIRESDDVALAGASTSGSLNLTSAGGIDQNPGSSLNVAGGAAFRSGGVGNINLVRTNRFGALTFQSNGSVQVNEADATQVAGMNTAAALRLQSAGAVSNATGASVIVTGNTNFSGVTINFGNQVGDLFTSGSLTFASAGAVTIAEDDSLTLENGSSSGALSLQSGGAIQSGAAAVDVAVNGNAVLTTLGPIGVAGNALSLTVSGVLSVNTQSPGGNVFITSPNGLTLGSFSTSATGTEAINVVALGGPLLLTTANVSNDTWFLQASGDVSFAAGSLLQANGVSVTSGGTIRTLHGGLSIDTRAAAGLIALSGAAGVGTQAAPLQIAPGDGELRLASTNGGIFLNVAQGDLKFGNLTQLSAGAANADIFLSTTNGDILVDGVSGVNANLLNDHLRLTQQGATHNIRFNTPAPLQVGRITIVSAGGVLGGGAGPDVDTSSTNSIVSVTAASVGEAGNPFAVNAGSGALQVRATTGDLRLEVWGGDLVTSRLAQVVAEQVGKNVEIATGDGKLTVDSLAGLLAVDDHLHLRAGGLNRDLVVADGITVRADQVHLSATGNIVGGVNSVAAQTTGASNRLELTAGGTIGSAANPFRVNQGLLFTNSVGDQFLATPTRMHVSQLISQGANGPLPPAGTVFLKSGDWVLDGGTTSSLMIETAVRLEGSGNINGNLAVQNGAFLSPGDGPAATGRIFVTGNLLLQPGSELILDINSPFTTPGVDFDELIVTGNVGLRDSILRLVGGQASDTRAIGAIKLIDVVGPGSTVTGPFQAGQGAIGPDSKIRVGTISSNIGYGLGDGNDIVLRDVTVSSPIVPDAAPPQLSLPIYTSNESRPIVLDIPPAQAVSVVEPPLEIEQEQTNVRKVLLMRLTPIDDEGNFEEQTLLRLEADWLKNLSAVFKSLPDDRYRLVLQMEGGELRRVMDVIIRGGRPFEPEPVQDAGLGEMPSDVMPDPSVDGQTEVKAVEEVSLPADTSPIGLPQESDVAVPLDADELRLNAPESGFRRGGMAAAAAALLIRTATRPWREDLEHALEAQTGPSQRRTKRWWRRSVTPRN